MIDDTNETFGILEHTLKMTPENGPRPAGKSDECFYCGNPIGSDHLADCVCRKKVVMVKATMKIPFVVPSNWDAHMVEFSLNDSSWCADNFIHDLERYMNAKGDGRCMCGDFKGKYLRDATEEDLEGIDLVKLAPHG